MKKNYQKAYIDISTEVRKSNRLKESLGPLFDLLYELEQVSRSLNEDKILADIYTLLGFHQSAYQVYQPVADLTNRKEIKKLHTLAQKAKSHANHFATKDVRKLRQKNKQVKLLPKDFKRDKSDANRWRLQKKEVVIFNKPLNSSKLEVRIAGNHQFEDQGLKIIDYIHWLGSCRDLLIEHYNSAWSDHTEENADDDWYDTLEIYSASINVGEDEELTAEVSVRDEFMPDHILDVVIEGKRVVEMNYDG
ncbi:MAG: hypothetical protein AAF789_10920 [Bacteroidota bacterium]